MAGVEQEKAYKKPNADDRESPSNGLPRPHGAYLSFWRKAGGRAELGTPGGHQAATILQGS